MNGRVNDGCGTVHLVNSEVTACYLPRRGHGYISVFTSAEVTCKLCQRIIKKNEQAIRTTASASRDRQKVRTMHARALGVSGEARGERAAILQRVQKGNEMTTSKQFKQLSAGDVLVDWSGRDYFEVESVQRAKARGYYVALGRGLHGERTTRTSAHGLTTTLVRAAT